MTSEKKDTKASDVVTELDGDQIRIQTNAVQVFEAWREADRDFRHSYKGRMGWSSINGKTYLYRSTGRVNRSLGPRSPETERIKEDYTAQRTRLRERRARLDKKLKELAPINVAYRLGRVPKVAAKVLEALDAAGLLGPHLLVVGTHSLYAYEAAAGVHFAGSLIATTDIDFMWDVRKKLKLAILDVPSDGVMGVLRGVDKSFTKSKQQFSAVNDDGYAVDLIRPEEPDDLMTKLRGLGDSMDLEAAAIMGLQWLINAPRFERIVVADNGRPLRMCCIDPRAYALYKLWMSKDALNREPEKRRRDRAQAFATAELATQRLGLPFNAKDLAALPLRLTQCAKDLWAKS